MIADYNQYDFSRIETFKYGFIGAMIGVAIGFLFFNSIYASLLLMPYGYLYLKSKKADYIEKRKWKLNLEFKDALHSISTALSAGYSLENSFIEAYQDLILVYENDALILLELKRINGALQRNESLDKSLGDFAKRSGVDDIQNFVNIIVAAKEAGGDLIKIMKSTIGTIQDKIEVKREIITLVSEKHLEAKIMNLIPMGIILYLNLFSPGFLRPLYTELIGIVFMSVLLVIYYFAFCLSKKIVNIEV